MGETVHVGGTSALDGKPLEWKPLRTTVLYSEVTADIPGGRGHTASLSGDEATLTWEGGQNCVASDVSWVDAEVWECVEVVERPERACRSIALDGTSGHVQLDAEGDIFNISDAVTITAWLQYDPVPSTPGVLFSGQHTTSSGPLRNSGVALRVSGSSDGGGAVEAFYATGATGTGAGIDPLFNQPPIVYGAGTWHFAGATMSSDGTRLFVGTEVGELTPFETAGPVRWDGQKYEHGISRLGAATPNGGTSPMQYFGGSIYEVAIWSRALSEAEVDRVRLEGPQAVSDQLQGWWLVDETGAFVDGSGQGRTGALVGGAAVVEACPPGF